MRGGLGSVTRWGQEYEGKRATAFVTRAKMGLLREHNQAPFFVAETKPPYMGPWMGGAQYAGVFGHPRRIMPFLVCPKHVTLAICGG